MNTPLVTCLGEALAHGRQVPVERRSSRLRLEQKGDLPRNRLLHYAALVALWDVRVTQKRRTAAPQQQQQRSICRCSHPSPFVCFLDFFVGVSRSTTIQQYTVDCCTINTCCYSYCWCVLVYRRKTVHAQACTPYICVRGSQLPVTANPLPGVGPLAS